MSDTMRSFAPPTLSLPDEFIVMLLDERSGYFHRSPGWNLSCAFIGAALAELSLLHRIDTDLESLVLVDRTETGNPVLDPILSEIADEPIRRNTQYWIERFAARADALIDLTLDRLVGLKILEHHEGDFWALAHTSWYEDLSGGTREGSVQRFIKMRVIKALFTDEIPDTRDIIVICLVDTCDIFRFMFDIDEETRELIGRSIASAVEQSVASPALRHTALSRKIPIVALRKLPFNARLREGNLPALFAELAREYGPVFQIRPPFAEPITFLAGPETNRWAHRKGRIYFQAKEYFKGIERVYGARRTIHSVDGADHFRYRKILKQTYSEATVLGRLDEVLHNARKHMKAWAVGDTLSASKMLRLYMNAQMSPLLVGIETQDEIEDILKYKERALNIHIMGLLPRLLMKTAGMRRREKAIAKLVTHFRSIHTNAQRAGCPRDVLDDFFGLHASDQQFLPESDLNWLLATALLGSMYLGDQLGFAVHAMVTHPTLYESVRAEADALFSDGDPGKAELVSPNFDVTRRLLMETLRLTPVASASMRHVMNTCQVENYELPTGSKVLIAQTAAHYMEEAFPDPYSFDIDRYLPPRNEHLSLSYAPYGLGPHRCIGHHWAELHLSINLLLLARYFKFELSPASRKLRINPFPSMSPAKKIGFVITERRHEPNE